MQHKLTARMIKGNAILISSPDDEARKRIAYIFKHIFIVYETRDIKTAIEIAKRNFIALMIIYDGASFTDVAALRGKMNETKALKFTKIVVLTSESNPYFQTTLRDDGADEVLPFPITSDELRSKIQAMLTTEHESRQDLKFENIMISPQQYLVRIDGQEIQFPRKEFELLYLLAKFPWRVFSRIEILTLIWEPGVLVSDRTIDVHIRRIRSKLPIDCIRTFLGNGYAFVRE